MPDLMGKKPPLGGTPSAKGDKKKAPDPEKEKKQKQPSALWMRYYRSLVLFIFLAVIIIGWFVVLGPMFNEYRNINVAAKKAEFDQYRQVLDRFQGILTEWEAVSAVDKERLNYFLPEGNDIPELITMLEDMAQQSGFVVTVASFSQVEQPIIDRTNVYPLILSLSLEGGDYNSLKTLIDKIETNLRLLDISSLNFQAGTGSYIMNINTYYINNLNVVK